MGTLFYNDEVPRLRRDETEFLLTPGTRLAVKFGAAGDNIVSITARTNTRLGAVSKNMKNKCWPTGLNGSSLRN